MRRQPLQWSVSTTPFARSTMRRTGGPGRWRPVSRRCPRLRGSCATWTAANGAGPPGQSVARVIDAARRWPRENEMRDYWMITGGILVLGKDNQFGFLVLPDQLITDEWPPQQARITERGVHG